MEAEIDGLHAAFTRFASATATLEREYAALRERVARLAAEEAYQDDLRMQV